MKRTHAAAAAAVLLALSLSLSAAAAPAQVQTALKAVELEKLATELQVKILLDGDYKYDTFELKEPFRLVVEITDIGRIEAAPNVPVDAFGVTAVRTGQFKPGVARVVFDLEGPSVLYKVVQNGRDLVLSFWRAGAPGAKPAAEPPPVETVAARAPVTGAPAAQAQPEAPAQRAHLKSLTHERLAGTLKVRLGLDGPFTFTTVVLNESGQILLDISPVDRISIAPSTDVNFAGIGKITVERLESGVARVAFNLNRIFPSFKVRPAGGFIEADFWEVPGVSRPVSDGGAAAAARPLVPMPNSLVGLFAGAYMMTDPVFEEVYGATAPIFGVEFSRIVYASGGLHFGVAAEARLLSRTGAGTETLDEATLTLIPLTLSGRLYFPGTQFTPYAGAGLDYYLYKETTPIGEMTGNALGFHVQAGLYYQLPRMEGLRLRVYGKYTGATATFAEEDFDVKLGGLEFGGGLAWAFDF